MGIPNSRKFPLVAMGRPTLLPLPVGRSPKPPTCLIPGPVRPMPSQTASGSVQPFFHKSLNTHRPTQTNRSLAWMVCDYRPLSLYRQPRGLIRVLSKPINCPRLYWSEQLSLSSVCCDWLETICLHFTEVAHNIIILLCWLSEPITPS